MPSSLEKICACLIGLNIAFSLAAQSRPAVRSWNGYPRSQPQLNKTDLHNARMADTPLCGKQMRDDLRAPRSNIWYGLTDEEAVDVTAWLFNQEQLNLTAAENATSWDNSINFMQLLLPNKTGALAYMDGSGPKPPRYAQVSLNLQATEDAQLTEITVGPLPVDQNTSWEYLSYPYTQERRGSVRNLNADDTTLYTDWLTIIGRNISDITLALWNKTAVGADNDTMQIYGIDPAWEEDGRIIRWDTFWALPDSPFDAISLLPQGLFIKSDVTGRDPSKWKLEGFLYNDIFYASEEDFREAFYAEGFERLPANVDGSWTHTDREGRQPPLDSLRTPRQIEPTDPRYSIDQEEKYIQWLDWTFFLRVDHTTGIALHDVRHKNNRILYELSMQEALAHYAGNDPVMSGIAFLDSYDGFTSRSRPLIYGYDCPPHASYMNVSYYEFDEIVTNINTVCLFESDTDHPLARHTGDLYITATKNTKLVLRWLTTIRNYDYLFSYEFYLDGSMEVKLQASGYIQGAYASNNDEYYGYRVHDQITGAPHEHVINFKADFDILGKENSLQLAEFVPVTKNYIWSKSPRNTFHIERSFVDSEDNGRMKWNGRAPTQYNIINTDKRNRFGEYRGYRISPGATACLTPQSSTNLGETAHPFTFDLGVTRHKDTELKSAHHYNAQDTQKPMVNFDNFFDGESLVQQDIVLWFNLGMHHLPSSGDIPNTLFNVAQSSVQIVPVNFYDSDPSQESSHRVRIELNSTTGTVDNVELFGQEDGVCSVIVGGQEDALYKYGQP